MADKNINLKNKKNSEKSVNGNLQSEKSSNVVNIAFGGKKPGAAASASVTGKGKPGRESRKEIQDEEAEDDYQHRIRIHRYKVIAVIIAAAIVLVIAGFFGYQAFQNIKYTGYSILHSENRTDTATASYVEYNGGYIRYSNDGIAYYSKTSQAIWNQTYEMSNPQVKICGNAVAVGDLNGTSIFIFDEKGMRGSVDTSLSIAQIEVASQGVVAAVLEDVNANYINLYNTEGEVLYTVKTTIAGDGYPLDISVSDDAVKLVASFIYVSGEAIKTNVVFYNFSEVGQNETERVVGGFNQYDSTIVPEVDFVNDTCAVAVGENVLSIYKIKEYPSLLKEINIEGEIDRVFTSNEYIGIVVKNAKAGDVYKLQVYDVSGGKISEKTFNTEYSVMKFDGKSVIMYNDTLFTLLNINGKTQLEQTFDLPVNAVLSLGAKGNYMLVNSKYIQEIKLK